MASFLTNARINLSMDGRTLDEVRDEMEDPPTLGRRRSIRLEQYDIRTKCIAYMKQPDKFADALLV